jgi:hypothetical protein
MRPIIMNLQKRIRFIKTIQKFIKFILTMNRYRNLGKNIGEVFKINIKFHIKVNQMHQSIQCFLMTQKDAFMLSQMIMKINSFKTHYFHKKIKIITNL